MEREALTGRTADEREVMAGRTAKGAGEVGRMDTGHRIAWLDNRQPHWTIPLFPGIVRG